MKPRRGLPEPSEPSESSEETELEMSAVRRGLWLDDERDPRVPRRASRAAADEPDLASVDLQPSGGTAGVAPQPKPKKPPQAKQPEADTSVSAGEPRAGIVPLGGRRTKEVVGAALLGVALAFGVGAIPGQPAPLPSTVPLVTAISRACPIANVAASTLVAFSSQGDIRLRQIGQNESTLHSGPLALPDQTTPVVITPTDPEASAIGGNLIHTGQQTWWGECRAALADQYVQLPGGAGAALTIVNPEPEAALVDVTLTGPEGEITGEGLRGITVEGNSQRVIDLAPLAGSVDALGARVRSSVGRVMVAGQVGRSDGGDFATSTLQADELVIASIPAHATKTRLLLTNPGTTRNVVKIEAAGQAGRYELPGFESYTLDAQRTVAVDLTEAIGGLPVALVISGRDDFAASAVLTVGSDFGIEPAQMADHSAAGQDLVGVVPGSGTLEMANPGSGEALVVIDWGPGQALANRTIAPGSIASIEVPAGAGQAHVTSTAPIAAAILLTSSEHPGLAIAELHETARSRSFMPIQADPRLGR